MGKYFWRIFDVSTENSWVYKLWFEFAQYILQKTCKKIKFSVYFFKKYDIINSSKVDIEVHHLLKLTIGSKTLRIPQRQKTLLVREVRAISGLFQRNLEWFVTLFRNSWREWDHQKVDLYLKYGKDFLKTMRGVSPPKSDEFQYQKNRKEWFHQKRSFQTIRFHRGEDTMCQPFEK